MTSWDFAPTHVVPGSGLPAWESPDVSRPTVPLDPLLPVQLLERRGDWSRVLCANGWSAWVDGRLLVTVPAEPPAAERPMGATGDPRPLLARVEDSLGRYRRAAEDLAGGRTDGEGFRRRTRGLRVGMVVDGESVWLYDAEHERWVHCDGAGLTTLAASSPPSLAGVAEAGAPRTPAPVSRGGAPPDGPGGTRLVDPDSLPPYAEEEAAERAEPPAGPGEPPAAPEPTRPVAPVGQGPPPGPGESGGPPRRPPRRTARPRTPPRPRLPPGSRPHRRSPVPVQTPPGSPDPRPAHRPAPPRPRPHPARRGPRGARPPGGLPAPGPGHRHGHGHGRRRGGRGRSGARGGRGDPGGPGAGRLPADGR
ncbi:hypothetical protein ACRAR1_27825 [Streptomyces sanyensis]|uniref:hypothetical protein n=1 Tax=Streptomyces sanyensis TaxID=568869 RepID=UPI003D786E16